MPVFGRGMNRELGLEPMTTKFFVDTTNIFVVQSFP